MNDSEMDKLIERGLSGLGPRDAFRAQVLRDSTAVLAQRSRPRTVWRSVGLAAAGILIAAVSFVWGRVSVPNVPVDRHTAAQQGAGAGKTMIVPADLVAWLKAARLFDQLGMEQRVALAYEHASRLIPSQMYSTEGNSGTVLAAEPDGDSEQPSEPLSRDIQSILAQCFGG